MKSNKNHIFKGIFKGLGTDIGFTLIFQEEERQKVEKAFQELKNFYREKEQIFSRFDRNSELSKLNNNLNNFCEASGDMRKVAESSLCFNKFSEGYFDPRIIEALENYGYSDSFKKANFAIKNEGNFPALENNLEEDLKIGGNKIFSKKRIDFSGIAKGYITDEAVKFLQKKGFSNFLLDSGGDMFASGLDQFGEKWKISIEGVPEEKLFFGIRDEAAATSGITRRKWEFGEKRFHHLVNPKNPNNFLFNLKSVTVIAKKTEEADVLAKVLFLMDREKGLLFSGENKVRSLFLDCRGNLFLSSEAKSFIKK